MSYIYYILGDVKTGRLCADGGDMTPTYMCDCHDTLQVARFSNKEAAIAEQQRQNSLPGTTKFFVVHGPVTNNVLVWRPREQERMDTGHYDRLCPELEGVVLARHYAHAARGVTDGIAYTRNELDGVRDLKKVLRITTYLEKYCQEIDKSERDRLESLQQRYRTLRVVKFAVTAAEIYSVYTNYADEGGVAASCMRYDSNHFHFKEPWHPTAAYGDSDLQVAYIVNTAGKTTARAIVWPDKKIYSRVYGSDRTIADLMALLHSMGYKKSIGYYPASKGTSDQSLLGARIRAIKLTSTMLTSSRIVRGSEYIMPYVDEAGMAAFGDDGTWLRLVADSNSAYGYISTRSTSGAATKIAPKCGLCSKDLDPEHTQQVRTGVSTSSLWCSSCAATQTYICAGMGAPVAKSIQAKVIDGHIYSKLFVMDRGYVCGTCDEWWLPEDGSTHDYKVVMHTVSHTHTNGYGSIEEGCPKCAKSKGFRALDGQYYKNHLTRRDLFIREGEDGVTEAISLTDPEVVSAIGGKYKNEHRLLHRKTHCRVAVLDRVTKTPVMHPGYEVKTYKNVYNALRDVDLDTHTLTAYTKRLMQPLPKLGSLVKLCVSSDVGLSPTFYYGVITSCVRGEGFYPVSVMLRNGLHVRVNWRDITILSPTTPTNWPASPSAIGESIAVGSSVVVMQSGGGIARGTITDYTPAEPTAYRSNSEYTISIPQPIAFHTVRRIRTWAQNVRLDVSDDDFVPEYDTPTTNNVS